MNIFNTLKNSGNTVFNKIINLKKKVKNKTKARCQVGNKAMKTKLTDILRGMKERKKICKVK